jgi:hypothetical protein
MDQYEIHILQNELSLALIATSEFMSDRRAIEAARRMAHGRQFEVWRGPECITSVAHLIPPAP